jgi:polyol transport system permease protein
LSTERQREGKSDADVSNSEGTDCSRGGPCWCAAFRAGLRAGAYPPLQSQDEEQKEAAEMDGARALSTFIYLTLPHLARPITVVILIETIFLLTVFAEIFVTTGGGPGLQTTNIAFLIYSQALIQYDVGNASAGGLVAVVIANIVAFFLVRIVGRNLEA